MNGNLYPANRRRRASVPFGRRPTDPLAGGLRDLYRRVLDAPLPADIAALLDRIDAADTADRGSDQHRA